MVVFKQFVCVFVVWCMMKCYEKFASAISVCFMLLRNIKRMFLYFQPVCF